MSLLELPPVPDLAGTKRAHRIEDDEEHSPAQLKQRILAALRERQPLDRKQLCVQLDVDDTDLGIALGNMRVNQAIHAVRGVGYYLGPKAGVSVIQKPEEEAMPRKARDADAMPTIEEETTKPKRKYTRRKKGKAAAEKPPVDQVRAGEPTFIVDDAGRVAILHDEQRIDLSAAATKRLVAFLDKHAS